ncbi:hypothetical protein [Caballeronia sp. ATUFL_M2_KS44]|uniref:terminase small subunit-like protein n=1 Tax=Caballeronia sp. ATUFL_M2_KS44 TaxID=2921767 RepID=UPI0020290A4C|nr:hypothetical protein [Caballeronia sp. ATUFL_M2_KS44]
MSTYRNAGRKTYPPVIADAIIAKVASGLALGQICEDRAMPCKQTFYNWISDDPMLSKRYADAVRAAIDARTQEVSHE